jgi:hypothetical protein
LFGETDSPGPVARLATEVTRLYFQRVDGSREEIGRPPAADEDREPNTKMTRCAASRAQHTECVTIPSAHFQFVGEAQENSRRSEEFVIVLTFRDGEGMRDR